MGVFGRQTLAIDELADFERSVSITCSILLE